MNTNTLDIKVLVEKELMVGFASPTSFDARIIADCRFKDGTVVVLNVFWSNTNGVYAFLVSITIVAIMGGMSVEIRDKNTLLECDIWESGNTLENVEKSSKSFIKRALSYGYTK